MTRSQLNRLFERVRRGCPWARRELVSRDTQAWVAHYCKSTHYGDTPIVVWRHPSHDVRKEQDMAKVKHQAHTRVNGETLPVCVSLRYRTPRAWEYSETPTCKRCAAEIKRRAEFRARISGGAK